MRRYYIENEACEYIYIVDGKELFAEDTKVTKVWHDGTYSSEDDTANNLEFDEDYHYSRLMKLNLKGLVRWINEELIEKNLVKKLSEEYKDREEERWLYGE